MKFEYDIIVVGAGHAGCEAAVAAAKMGSQVLLITMDMTKVAHMSCNPAIGGVAKGQIVREIDALGGQMGIITDQAAIQFRMLNRSKGPAMWSPRAQCDKYKFTELWKTKLEHTDNLYLWQDTVSSLDIEDMKVRGVWTQMGVHFAAKSVILTTGTFMDGVMHVGRCQAVGGRAGDQASTGITQQLVALGFEAGRMKTGTPVRIDGRTVNFEALTPQPGDEIPSKFSFSDETQYIDNQCPCYLAYTSVEVHDQLRKGFQDSPLFNGTIRGIGPRYCPSIEDKLNTFADKDQHQLFLEPESAEEIEYYLNGFSSSLPLEVQVAALQKIVGFENVHIFRPGYAIEYDYFPPTCLRHTMETKAVEGLYFAGQINGTTGYEEAAAQGLMAGINAHRKINSLSEVILNRDQAYIGVLIDDLVTKGVDEPYRMFTSRAEYRILLRGDNADSRLTQLGYDIGLADQQRLDTMLKKNSEVEQLMKFIKDFGVTPESVKEYLIQQNSPVLTQKRKLYDLILRNEITITGLSKYIPELSAVISTMSNEAIEECEILVKYGGYIDREKQAAEKMHRLENTRIKDDFDFNSLHSLSIEARQKLTKIQPTTIGQASRIPGVSPADINVLLVYFGR
jgi:tRNA uridine 5-carboxymethylaminomethyl modification enzyme